MVCLSNRIRESGSANLDGTAAILDVEEEEGVLAHLLPPTIARIPIRSAVRSMKRLRLSANTLKSVKILPKRKLAHEDSEPLAQPALQMANGYYEQMK